MPIDKQLMKNRIARVIKYLLAVLFISY